MKLCCVPDCSVGYEFSVHVALRPLRQSVLLVILVLESILLCGQHHRAVYRFCFPDKEIECAMCGVRR